ncbi:MAG: class I SAM-dependent RNA methyltransferase [Clostridia bacterium]
MSIYDGKLRLSATVAGGIEAVTKREILGLGLVPGPAINGRICFEGDFLEMARANMFLRTANHIYINLAEFKAVTFDELFDSLSDIEWEHILPKDARILVDAKSNKSVLFALSAIQRIAKKAIVERLKYKYRLSMLPETAESYHIEISITDDMVLVALDTSGDGLHKRGYRPIMGLAPMKETLAAAIIELSVWKHDRPLIDCFCGSGTIPIEAALIGTNTAPGLIRNFSYMQFDNAPQVYDIVRKEALDKQLLNRKLRISGFDIDNESIKMAMIHAEKAGMSDYIHFQNMDMREVSSRFGHGVIISNLPFGERLLNEKTLLPLYRDFGAMVRSLDEWSCYAFTSYPDFERQFGMRADKKRKLYSSQLECVLYQFLGAKPSSNKSISE